MFWYIFMVLQSCHYTTVFFQLWLVLSIFLIFPFWAYGNILCLFFFLCSLLFPSSLPSPSPSPYSSPLPSSLVLLLREHAYLYAKPAAISNIWITVLTLRGVFLRYSSDVFCEQLRLYKSHWHMYFLNIGLSMFLSTDNCRFSPAKGWASPPSCWALPNPIGVEEETQNIWKSPKPLFHS